MADTHHFNTVAEASVATLNQVFQQAWKSGGDTGATGVIPEFFDFPGGATFGPYTLQKVHVHIPQESIGPNHGARREWRRPKVWPRNTRDGPESTGSVGRTS